MARLAAAVRTWPWFAVPAVVAVASRVYSLAVLTVLSGLHGMRGTGGLLSVWDAAWYLRIADGGYHGGVVHGGRDFAFFPAWPILVKIASLGGRLPADVVATVLANALFVVAAVLIWRVLETRMGSTAATGGIALLAFAPPAYVFSLPYAEPLFLLAVGCYYLAGPTSRWRLPLAALAMFTRIAGAAVVASALQRAATTKGRERLAALAAAVAGTVAFAVWWGFIAIITRQFTGFLHGAPGWGSGRHGLLAVVAAVRLPSLARIAWLGFIVVAGVGSLLVVRRDPELAVFSLVTIAVALVLGNTVNSMARYALTAFPAFGALADVIGRRDRRLLAALVVVGAVLQIAFARWVLLAAPLGVAP
jgi:hypothetical protein